MFILEIRKTDRRQNNISVENDRRSGVDRRDLSKDTSVFQNASAFEALKVIPQWRRISSVKDKMNNDDEIGALGSVGLMLINLPEDKRDVIGVVNQLTGAEPLYDYKNFQHPFSFFRGTMLEKWLHKNVAAGKKWAKFLYNNDISLYNTISDLKFLKPFIAEEKDAIKSNIKDYRGKSIKAFSFTGNKFAKLTARALKRTTLLGVIAMCLFELPKIFKSDKKIKQVEKSAINVVSITAGIGYIGAIGFKYGGSTGSLIGMGLGAVLGGKLSQKTQELI